MLQVILVFFVFSNSENNIANLDFSKDLNKTSLKNINKKNINNSDEKANTIVNNNLV